MKLKVAAGTVFFGSKDILRLAIWNLIAQGIEYFYLIHHDEASDFDKAFVAEFSGRAKIRFANKSTPAFMQGRMVTILAEIARRDGFEVFIPFDSDEFLVNLEGSPTLLEQLESKLIGENELGFEIEVVDHIQAIDAVQFSLDALLTAEYVGVSSGAKLDGVGSINEPLGNFLARENVKVIVNLRALPEVGSYFLSEGFHHLVVHGQNARLCKNHSLEIAHLPYRSLETFALRHLDGIRRDAGGFGTRTSPRNLALWAAGEEQLKQRWREITWVKSGDSAVLADGNPQVELVRSGSLRRVHASVISHSNSAMPGPGSWDEVANAKFRQQILDLAIDTSLGFPATEDLINQIKRLSGERDRLAALLRRHAPEITFKLTTKAPISHRLKRGANKVLRKLGLNLRNR